MLLVSFFVVSDKKCFRSHPLYKRGRKAAQGGEGERKIK